MKTKLAVVLGTCAVLVAACGDDGGESGEAAKSSPTAGAKVIDVGAMESAKGDVTFCTGKDVTGALTAGVERFNAAFPNLSAQLLEFAASADEQRSQFVQRQEAKSSECDIFASDGVWQAEFVSQEWLYDLTPYVEGRAEQFIPATLENMKIDERYFGVQKLADAGFLYYRTDQVAEAPATWQDAYDLAAQEDGLVYQGAQYEGLTVDFLELALGAGGDVLSDDGKKSVFNSPQNQEALQLMVDGIKNGTVPRGVTTYMEEEARRYFESGKATFMRNWPYAYALGQKAPAVKGKFAVATLPAFAGGERGGILGGQVLVISTFSGNPGGALKLIDFLTSPETLKRDAIKNAWASPLMATYDDPAVRKALPFASTLRDAISQASPRPVSPVYPQISQAIYENVHDALSGRTSAKEALENADSEINSALATF